MLSASDDDVGKRLLEKSRFELAVKGVFKLGRCYILWQGIRGCWASFILLDLYHLCNLYAQAH